jgi:hypothetical protein
MHFVRALAFAGILPFLASAHVQMAEPFPINSAKDPAVPENLKDNDMNKPLDPSGSDFPCKGYHKQETSHVSKATYKAGGTGKISFAAGGAPHGGGSCQISLSYDNGATWKVIKSMIGGCPTTPSYDFTVPQDAPSSTDVLLGWTWFNLVGNREMYMNCARVTVEGSAPGRHRRAEVAARQGGMSSLPDMFTCNIGQGCKTKENVNVDFPNPGADVVRGENTMRTEAGAGFGGGAGGVSGGSGSGAPPPAAPTPSPASGGASGAPDSAPAPFPNATSAGSAPKAGPTGGNVVIPVPATPSAPAAPAPAPAAPASGGSCTAGSIVCNSPTTWSMCVGGAGGATSLTSMGSTAPGTTCVDGKIA